MFTLAIFTILFEGANGNPSEELIYRGMLFFFHVVRIDFQQSCKKSYGN